jgi:hypothetical protein
VLGVFVCPALWLLMTLWLLMSMPSRSASRARSSRASRTLVLQQRADDDLGRAFPTRAGRSLRHDPSLVRHDPPS